LNVRVLSVILMAAERPLDYGKIARIYFQVNLKEGSAAAEVGVTLCYPSFLENYLVVVTIA
jgi:hypothetical protein